MQTLPIGRRDKQEEMKHISVTTDMRQRTLISDQGLTSPVPGLVPIIEASEVVYAKWEVHLGTPSDDQVELLSRIEQTYAVGAK